MRDLPLGKNVGIPKEYSPSSLVPITRADQRRAIEFDLSGLNCEGTDVWRCFELTWLDQNHIPRVAELELTIPCDSPKTIESKSLKLYLGSLCNTPFKSRDSLRKTLQTDLQDVVQANIDVEIHNQGGLRFQTNRDVYELSSHIQKWPSDLNVSRLWQDQPDERLLKIESTEQSQISYLCDCFYCLCPVTGQPDQAHVLITIDGLLLSASRLFAYLVSFRSTRSFHETVTERIYRDIWNFCSNDLYFLEVKASFHRRGGISIVPQRRATCSRRSKDLVDGGV